MSVATPVLADPVLDRDAAAPLAGRLIRGVGAGALMALPALLTLYLSFNSGGYFPGTTAIAVAVLAGAVVIRMALAREPFAGVSPPLAAVLAFLGAYSLWTLISASWSHSPSRALLYFDLANVYLFAVLLFGSSSRSERRVRWMVVLTWVAMLAVCAAALATRLRPDLFPIPVNLSPERLAFPLTYWNALGIFAVLGLVFAVYSASSVLQPAVIRVVAAASIPVFGMTILLTFSRGAIALAPAVLVAYAVLARPRGLPAAVAAAALPTAKVLRDAYHAGLIDNGSTSVAAAQQGRHLLTTLALACAAAAIIRGLLLPLDAWLARIRIPRAAARTGNAALATLVVGGVVAAGLLFSHQISREWGKLVAQNVTSAGDVRGHLETYNLNDRVPGWRIALHVFDANRLRGSGAGTFELQWERLRPDQTMATETHSLYLEALSELGIIGLILIAVPILAFVGCCVARSRRSSRSLWIALAIAGLAWAVHAGIDWDWQMPAVTLPVFALMATALARRGAARRIRPRLEIVLRIAVGVAAVAIAFTALRIAVSDSNVNGSVNAFNSADCQTAVRDAQAAIAAVSSRAQPYAVIGFCDLQRRGAAQAAVSEMRAAEARDPLNWRYHYDLAVADAAAGADPRPELRAAQALDPLEPTIQTELAAFRAHERRSWPRLAHAAPTPVELRQ